MKSTTYFLKEIKKLELVRFEQAVNEDILKESYLPFSGSLRHHPYDADKVILLSEPHGNNITYYEFKNDDIGFVKKQANIVNLEGEDIAMVMIWIKKGCIGIRCTPFLVESVI